MRIANRFVGAVAAIAGATALAGAANAGGFSRGTADTDILFEDGNFAMRIGVAHVMPQRGFETINGSSTTDGNYSDAYTVPSHAIKIGLTEDLSCAGTYTSPYGASATYGMDAIVAGLADGTGTADKGFTSNEFGATCGYKFDMPRGRAWIIGGLFAEDFSYSETVRLLSAANLTAASHPLAIFGGATDLANSGTLAFDGSYELGYRIGVAYEIPEIALRAQLLYRSQIDHNPNGTFRFFDTATGATLFAGAAILPTVGTGSLPQSLELKAQSGIAPGWLAFGSVKWTDWSVLQTLDYTIFTPAPVPTNLEFFWKDGWTVNGGIGHAFNDYVSGSVSLTWDKGVSTTEDVQTDTWTVSGGVAVAAGERGEFRFGGAVSYLTSGSVAAETSPTGDGPGDTFAYTVDNDWAYALAGSFKVNW